MHHASRAHAAAPCHRSLRQALVAAGLLLAGAVAGACAHDRASGSAGGASGPGQHELHRFDDPEAWAKSFEDPKRDAWQQPEAVLAALALPPDAILADIGSATGYFSLRLAKALPKGWVYGVDIESAMVDYLKRRVARERIANVTPVLGAFDDARLPKPVDVALMVNTYHHIEGRSAYFSKLRASLKPGGRVAIIEFRQDSPLGPPHQLRLSAEDIAREMKAAGFGPPVRHDFLKEQHFLVFSPEPASGAASP